MDPLEKIGRWTWHASVFSTVWCHPPTTLETAKEFRLKIQSDTWYRNGFRFGLTIHIRLRTLLDSMFLIKNISNTWCFAAHFWAHTTTSTASLVAKKVSQKPLQSMETSLPTASAPPPPSWSTIYKVGESTRKRRILTWCAASQMFVHQWKMTWILLATTCQAAWKKNVFLGLKRGRFISAPFNATLQMSFTVSLAKRVDTKRRQIFLSRIKIISEECMTQRDNDSIYDIYSIFYLLTAIRL